MTVLFISPTVDSKGNSSPAFHQPVFSNLGENMHRIVLAAITVGVALTSLPALADDYQAVFQSVDQNHLQTFLKDMSGSNPVTVGDETFTISERYTPESKAHFRKYWTAYFQSLGLQVNALNYDTQYNLESQGHNVEAILPGKSADSVVVIVHYDSIGPHGADNPGVDDDMTGMSTMLETARILTPYGARLQHTVRFVAADYEEWGDLEGSAITPSTSRTFRTNRDSKLFRP